MSNFKFNVMKKRTWGKILSIGLAVLLFAGAIFGLVKLGAKLKEETKTISPSWKVGVVDETTGKVNKELKSSIYTDDAFDAKGLKVVLDYDSNVSYQVFWFDSVGEFAYCSEEMTKGAEFYAPAGHKARVEVTPIFDANETEDETISWYETYKYSKQVEIIVDKNQTLEAKDFTEYSLDVSMFTAHNGSVKFSGNGVASYDENENTTYEYRNDGKFSAVYVKGYELAEGNTGLHVRLLDGTVISYYSSDLTISEIGKEKALPMSANDAILLPKGATLYVWGLFGEAGTESGPENTTLCFY